MVYEVRSNYSALINSLHSARSARNDANVELNPSSGLERFRFLRIFNTFFLGGLYEVRLEVCRLGCAKMPVFRLLTR